MTPLSFRMLCFALLSAVAGSVAQAQSPPPDAARSELVGILKALPKAHGRRPETSTQSGLPELYTAGANQLKKRTDVPVREVFSLYLTDAQRGDPVAQASVARMYATGAGVAKDETQAVAWARRAAEQGNPGAQTSLAAYLWRGEGTPADPAEAYRWYRKSAEAGEPIAQFVVAYCLAEGKGVAQNREEASVWRKKAAENDLPEAAAALSAWYDGNDEGRKDPEAALRWLRKAADLGDAQSQVYLGNRYAWGLSGVQSDMKTAVELYRKAAVVLEPKNEEELRKYMVQAQAAIREKKFGEAQQLIEKARITAPWSDRTWYNAALVYAENGHFAAAIHDMQMFLVLAPTSPQARGGQDLIYEWERKVKK